MDSFALGHLPRFRITLERLELTWFSSRAERLTLHPEQSEGSLTVVEDVCAEE